MKAKGLPEIGLSGKREKGKSAIFFLGAQIGRTAGAPKRLFQVISLRENMPEGWSGEGYAPAKRGFVGKSFVSMEKLLEITLKTHMEQGSMTVSLAKLSIVILLLGMSLSAKAQSVVTDPVGFVTVTATAGTGSTSTTSVLSLPLLNTASITGSSIGIVTGVTANTVSNANAGWTAAALSAATTPYLIQITSGAAQGRTFLISTSTANTSTTVTLDATDASTTDLTTLGIVAGTDTYSIFPCDTIASVFGTPATTGVLGGTSSANADVIQLFVSGAWRQYFYSTTSGNWVRAGLNTVSNNVVIRPDAGLIYSRLSATSLALTLTGRVPAINRQAVVTNSGVTFLSNSWPVNLTLGTSNFSSISGWVSGANASSADTVQMLVSGAWRQYFYNGSHWIRAGLNTVSDSVVISAGTSVILSKIGSTSGVSLLSQNLPYTL